MTRHMRIILMATFLGALIAISGEAVAGSSNETLSNAAFAIISESAVYAKSSGMLMICPAHNHGTPEEAMAKLKGLLHECPEDQNPTVWVCRANQIQTLAMFAPVVDQVVINPFVVFEEVGPEKNDDIWPKYNHPIINQIRQIRKVTGNDKRVLACVDLRGEPKHFSERQASFEEVQWMIFSLIGARYDGVVWRARKGNLPWQGRLRRLEDNLQSCAASLGAARAVGWAKEAEGKPISTLASKDHLYICLLNQNYMQIVEGKDTIRLPLDPQRPKFDIVLSPPAGTHVVSGRTLSGVPLALEQAENTTTVNHRLSGGGEMLIFELTRHSEPEHE